MATYKITAIAGGVTTIDFVHSDNSTSTQALAGLPVNDADELTAAITAYNAAYEKGKAIEAATRPAPDAAVVAAIGKVVALDVGALLADQVKV